MSIPKANYLPASATDPLTSWAAAEHVESSGKARHQRAIAVAAVNAHPGLTSFELSRVCSLDRYQLGRRLPECAGVVKGEPRKCKVSGNQAHTWWPVSVHKAA